MILVDTGPLVAAGNRKDRHHNDCLQAIQSAPYPRLVPATVVTETCYLLARDAGIEAEALFLDAMASGFFTPVDIEATDYARMAELLRQYADRPLDATDASIVAVAERLNVVDIITLDKTDFTLVRPKHVDAFTLVP